MVPNPCEPKLNGLPKLYGLPKTHKPILKMRPIVSNIGSPTEKVSKWLVKEYENYEQPEGKSIQNVFDFVQKVENAKIGPDEIDRLV